MSERKKTSTDPMQESDRQFLERTGVSSQIKDVLTKVIENRPEDPIAFLADYFETVGDKSNKAVKAYQQLCLTHHSKPAFDTNVRIAYDILSQHKVLSDISHNGDKEIRKRVQRNLKGVNGIIYTELLLMICKSFPPQVTDKLLKKIKCRDHEVVVFDIFHSGVFTCLVLQDFVEQAEALYECLDGQKTGKVERQLCEAVAGQLHTAVRVAGETPGSFLDAGYMLGPRNLHETVAQALMQTSSTSKKTMSSEEFVSSIAEAFISKVKPLK